MNAEVWRLSRLIDRPAAEEYVVLATAEQRAARERLVSPAEFSAALVGTSLSAREKDWLRKLCRARGRNDLADKCLPEVRVYFNPVKRTTYMLPIDIADEMEHNSNVLEKARLFQQYVVRIPSGPQSIQ